MCPQYYSSNFRFTGRRAGISGGFLPRLGCGGLLLLGLWCGGAQADTPIRMCYEDTSVYPWITGDDQGLLLFEMHLVEQELGRKFEFIRLPWKRCQQEVRQGSVQAAMGASFKRERMAWGTYPMNADGTPNKELRLFVDSFYIFRRSDSPVRWVQQQLKNLGAQVVGAQLGYSVGADLAAAGYPIKYFPSSDDLVRLLDRGLLQVAVLQNHEAMNILKHSPALAKTIMKEGEPVKTAEQYLLFNTDFYQRETPLVHAIWQAVERVRKSKKYQDEEALVLAPSAARH